ncbi:MAG: NADH-quinone oxidoreductase subunit F, partial [Chloroflexi bacterium]|nr:NADH-quinone oxidoreductase subunit F [Chloroflexota bacterium]
MAVALDYKPVLLAHPGRTTPVSLQEYESEGGYSAWRKALTSMTPDQVVEEVKASGLRGRGGAGFPTGNKWGFIPKTPGAKYVAVNADESEPGTFKDRELVEVERHRVIEGVALCCFAISAETAFIYIRGEYIEAANRLEAAIADAEAAGLLGRGCVGTQVNVRI